MTGRRQHLHVGRKCVCDARARARVNWPTGPVPNGPVRQAAGVTSVSRKTSRGAVRASHAENSIACHH